jgi:hypothetical protein
MIVPAPQVAAYGNYVDLLTIRDGIAAAWPDGLKMSKDPFSIVQLLFKALRLEALAATEHTASALRELLMTTVNGSPGLGDITDNPHVKVVEKWVKRQSRVQPGSAAAVVMRCAERQIAVLRGLRQDLDGEGPLNIRTLCWESRKGKSYEKWWLMPDKVGMIELIDD